MDNLKANESLRKTESLKKIHSLLKRFNETFTIEANIITDENGEEVTNGLHIKKLNNDGAEFMDDIFSTFSQIVKGASDEHELVYDEQKGLAIAHKKIVYEIEE